MELTQSFLDVIDDSVVQRFVWREVRNAAAVLHASNPTAMTDLIEVLTWFELTESDIMTAGGNRSDLAARLDEAFRKRGWREGRHDTRITSELRLMPWRKAGEKKPEVRASEVVSEGYKVDNVKDRVALDVEWNAKDGNLDRDLGAYAALYDAGIIDVGVIITRHHQDTRALADAFGQQRFRTTTTTNIEKLEPRLTRGAARGCPVLAIAISARTFTNKPDSVVPAE